MVFFFQTDKEWAKRIRELLMRIPSTHPSPAPSKNECSYYGQVSHACELFSGITIKNHEFHIVGSGGRYDMLYFLFIIPVVIEW